MATETSLNQIVKGAPPPGTKVRDPSPLPPLAKASAETVAAIKQEPQSESETPPPPYHHRPPPTIIQVPATRLITSTGTTTTDNLPSSPPQIYLNLLILESSLRAQYLTLLSRRRLNTFFIALLATWNIVFTYFLFLRPREDGSGKLGGSPYWVVEAAIRLGFIAGVVASLLIKATGQWESGIRWPRRWLNTTNRGLRGFNLRAVVVRRSVHKEAISHLKALAPWAGLADGSGDWHLVESPPTSSDIESGKTNASRIVEEDLSPSGDHLLLLLLPKNFSSEFRENWETYRSEYWERENERRTSLRRKVAVHKRNKAKDVGGWRWWSGAWRVIPHASHRKNTHKGGDLEKHPHGHGHQRTDSRRNSGLPPGAEKVQDALAIAATKASRRRSLLRDSSTHSHSRQSSRGGGPQYMLDGTMEMVLGDSKERVRRGSSVSSTGSARRSLRSQTGSVRRGEGLLSPLTMTDEPGEIPPKKERVRRSRPSTPTVSSSESVLEDGVRVKKESVAA